MNRTDHCAEPTATLLTVEQARQQIDQQLPEPGPAEQLGLKQSLGRITAADLHAPTDQPRHRVSAMDGYAVHSADLSSINPLNVVGTSWAGRPFPQALRRGEAVRIFTGAVLPDSADSVLMQEQVERRGEQISVPLDATPQAHIRHPGSDIKAGERLIAKGRKVTAADLGLLASHGISQLKVRPRLRIGYCSTGDELRPVGTALKAGEIYDSNRYSLYGLLAELPVIAYDLGVIGDRKSALIDTFQQASQQCDVIITTGGVSVGEADLVKPVLEQLGAVSFWKIAMKPGKPLAFGTLGDALFFGLPGNPVSVAVTFAEIVQPALMTMIGAAPQQPLRFHVPCRTALPKVPGRQEFQRGALKREADGTLTVSRCGQQDSHRLSGLSQANCYIILPAECSGIEAGALVEVEPLDRWIDR